jgi:uncharacterized protein
MGMDVAGGDEAYDESYWAARNPVNVLEKLVTDRIPAFLVGGWNDLFQRGELLNYTGLQNAYDGRPVLAPMSPNQPITPRYQLMMGRRFCPTIPPPPRRSKLSRRDS